jgi:hypothetical protein
MVMDALEFPAPRTAPEARIRAAELWEQQVRMLLAYCDMRDLAERLERQEREASLARRELKAAHEFLGKNVSQCDDY